MNLCCIKNMIQLSNLDLRQVGNLLSRQDLRDSVSFIKLLCLGKCFEMLFKEKFGGSTFNWLPRSIHELGIEQKDVWKMCQPMLPIIVSTIEKDEGKVESE
jgi:hypothetical protein